MQKVVDLNALQDVVMLIDETGKKVGNYVPEQAIRLAKEQVLDLILLENKDNLSICKLADYNKILYKQNKSKKTTTNVKIKEVKFNQNIAKHDINIKIKRINEFLEDGNLVKIITKRIGRKTVSGVEPIDKLNEILTLINLPYKVVNKFESNANNCSIGITLDKKGK
jgi:translation initiation factor IF-3